MEGVLSISFLSVFKDRLKVLSDRPYLPTAIVAPQVVRMNRTASVDLSETFSSLFPCHTSFRFFPNLYSTQEGG